MLNCYWLLSAVWLLVKEPRSRPTEKHPRTYGTEGSYFAPGINIPYTTCSKEGGALDQGTAV